MAIVLLCLIPYIKYRKSACVVSANRIDAPKSTALLLLFVAGICFLLAEAPESARLAGAFFHEVDIAGVIALPGDPVSPPVVTKALANLRAVPARAIIFFSAEAVSLCLISDIEKCVLRFHIR